MNASAVYIRIKPPRHNEQVSTPLNTHYTRVEGSWKSQIKQLILILNSCPQSIWYDYSNDSRKTWIVSTAQLKLNDRARQKMLQKHFPLFHSGWQSGEVCEARAGAQSRVEVSGRESGPRPAHHILKLSTSFYVGRTIATWWLNKNVILGSGYHGTVIEILGL